MLGSKLQGNKGAADDRNSVPSLNQTWGARGVAQTSAINRQCPPSGSADCHVEPRLAPRGGIIVDVALHGIPNVQEAKRLAQQQHQHNGTAVRDGKGEH